MTRFANIPGLTLSSSPPECTPDPAAENARQERIEELARAEVLRCDDRFADWLKNAAGDQLEDAARLIAASFDLGERTGRVQCAFWTLQGRILADYTAWRMEQDA